jgi:hypothetical protein
MLNNKRTVFFSIFIATIAIWLFIFSVDSVRASLYEMANPNRVPLSGLTPPAEPASSEKGSVTDINPDNYRPVINITIGGFTKWPGLASTSKPFTVMASALPSF